MNLLLRSLLLVYLHGCPSWSVSSGSFVATQSPDVSVTEGDTVNITCCWTEKAERVGVNWLKNQTEIKTEIITNNQSQDPLKKEAKICSTLTFPDITREDSGKYICKVTVEIPSLTVYEGTGTVISVTARESEKNDDNTNQHTGGEAPTGELFMYLLRSLPILALITAFFWLYYLGTKAEQNTPAAPVYEPTSAHIQEEHQEEEERDDSATETAKQSEKGDEKSDD